MRTVKSITKIIHNINGAASRELDLFSQIKLSQTEFQELQKAITTQDSDMYSIEVEFKEGENQPNYFIVPAPQGIQLDYINDYFIKSINVKNRLVEIEEQLRKTEDARATRTLQMNQDRTMLQSDLDNATEYNKLVVAIPDLETEAKRLSADVERAIELQSKIKNTQKIDDNRLEQLKQTSLESREKFLLSLNTTLRRRQNLPTGSETAVSTINSAKTSLTKVFLPAILIVLLVSAFALILTANILIPLLSILFVGLLAVTYWLALQIPPRIELGKNRLIELNESQTPASDSLTTEVETIEKEVYSLINSKKAELESVDIQEQLKLLLQNKSLSDLKLAYNFVVEELKLTKEKAKELSHLSNADLLQLQRDLDIIIIDISRLQVELSSDILGQEIMSRASEIDLINTQLKEHTELSRILSLITGFRMIRSQDGKVEGLSSSSDEWIGVELTQIQMQQISIINQLEKWLDSFDDSPIFIVNWNKLFSTKQQDLLNTRIQNLRGINAQVIQLELE